MSKPPSVLHTPNSSGLDSWSLGCSFRKATKDGESDGISDSGSNNVLGATVTVRVMV